MSVFWAAAGAARADRERQINACRLRLWDHIEKLLRRRVERQRSSAKQSRKNRAVLRDPRPEPLQLAPETRPALVDAARVLHAHAGAREAEQREGEGHAVIAARVEHDVAHVARLPRTDAQEVRPALAGDARRLEPGREHV